MNNKKEFQNTADQGHEKQSAKAYLRFLESKGATTRILYLRSRFLDAFTINLVGQAQTRKAYSVALKITMETLDDNDKQLALQTSREFFPFWVNDIKAIAKFEHAYGFVTESTQWQPQLDSLASLTEQIDQEMLSAKERADLINYAEALDNKGHGSSKIEKRSKLAKIMLICLRDAPENNHMAYRSAVDAMLLLFKTDEVKKSYLEVAREFYPIWNGKQVAI